MKETTHKHITITFDELATKLGIKGNIENMVITINEKCNILEFDVHE